MNIANADVTSNILQFPKEKWKTPSQTMEEVYSSIEESRKEHIQILVQLLMEYMTYKVCAEGFDITQDSCETSYLMVCESIEAMLSKSVGIHHPIQEVADDAFGKDDDSEKN